MSAPAKPLRQQPWNCCLLFFATLLSMLSGEANCQVVDQVDLFMMPTRTINAGSSPVSPDSVLTLLDSTDTVQTKAFVRLQSDSTLDSLFITLRTDSDSVLRLEEGFPEVALGVHTINGFQVRRSEKHYLLDLGYQSFRPPFVLQVEAKNTLGNLETIQTVTYD